MQYKYDKLWKMLIDRKMTRTQMREQAGVTTNSLAKMGKEEPVSIEVLGKICALLDCSLEDIVEVIVEPGDRNEEETNG